MFLERILAPVFPAWALSRLQSRLAFESLNGMYDGGKASRRTKNWRTPSTSASAETRYGLHRLRDRARDLVRNNPYAEHGLDLLVAYQVGGGIIPRSATGDRDLDKQADDLWNAWGPYADPAGREHIYSLMSQAARSRSESGEVLITTLPISSRQAKAIGSPVPLQIQIHEADYIDSYREFLASDGGITRQGIEFDPNGRVRAYWLFPEHPGDNWVLALKGLWSRRVPADGIHHMFRAERPGQIRGVPDLASVITRLRMLDDYEDAALEQARVQACLAAFVTSSAPAGRGPLEGPRDAETGQRRRTLAPGMIERLGVGEDVKFNSLPAPQGLSAFAQHVLRSIAAGAYGMTYDLLTGDLSAANYSSLRAGRLAFRRHVRRDQQNMLVPQMCQPIYQAFAAAAQLAGKLPPRVGDWPVKWAPPHFDLLDPEAEYSAARLAVRSGFTSWGQAVAESGHDPKEQVEEIKLWNALLKDAGIILDTDPRFITGAGLAQDPKQNAVVEIAASGAAGPPAPTEPAPKPADAAA